jgi:hypothetical protein
VPRSDEQSFYVKSVTANGVTYTRDPLPFEDGMVIRGARIVLSTESSKLHGRVRTEQKEDAPPASGANVLLVPADARQWRWIDRQQLARTDLQGEFQIEARPGDYLAFVLPRDERPRPLTEEEITRFSNAAQRITLRAGKTEQLELLLPPDK